MCLYDGQIYEQIPTLRIGVAVEEGVCYNFRIGPDIRPPSFTLQYSQQFIV